MIAVSRTFEAGIAALCTTWYSEIALFGKLAESREERRNEPTLIFRLRQSAQFLDGFPLYGMMNASYFADNPGRSQKLIGVLASGFQ